MSRIYDTESIEHIKNEIEAERAQAPLKVGEDENENKQEDASSINGVPESVKLSQFGCFNCLWFGVECKNGSNYEAHEEHGKINCASYAYYN